MIKTKHIKIIFILTISFLIQNCQIKKATKNHGINYLENRYVLLESNKSNRNDVIKILGKPHVQSIEDKNTWMYFERVFTKGQLHKLGRNVLTENNVVVLNFNNKGILQQKKLITKEEMKKIDFSEIETKNIKTQKSFVSQLLSSVKQKMYKDRKN